MCGQSLWSWVITSFHIVNGIKEWFTFSPRTQERALPLYQCWHGCHHIGKNLFIIIHPNKGSHACMRFHFFSSSLGQHKLFLHCDKTNKCVWTFSFLQIIKPQVSQHISTSTWTNLKNTLHKLWHYQCESVNSKYTQWQKKEKVNMVYLFELFWNYANLL